MQEDGTAAAPPEVVSIVDYNAGNLRSVANMLARLGFKSTVSNRPEEIALARKIILPGVGKFDFGMSSLRESGLLPALRRAVEENGVPLLGICLGAQLITRGSEEGVLPGLGWIPADTVAFDRSRLGPGDRVPHMGWSDTECRADCRLFAGSAEIPRYYYVHSYHLVCDSADDEICHATHGYRFVSGVERGNVLGVQFHPEKSHAYGMQVLRNFMTRY